MLELKEVKRNKNKNKPSTIRGTDRHGKNRKERRKQCNVLEEKKKKKKENKKQELTSNIKRKREEKKFVSRLLHSYNSISLSIILGMIVKD